MKSNSILWRSCALPLFVVAVLILPGCNRRDAELAATREKELEAVRAELEQTKARAAGLESDVTRLTKDTEELLRLRNEVRQLREGKQELTKQVQSAQAAAQGAQAQAAELAEAQKQQLANATQQAEYQARMKAFWATPQGQAAACINNLRQIDGAKQQWALENRKTDTDMPNPQDIAVYIRERVIPTCPAGGMYTIHTVSAHPTCSIPGHALPQP